MQGNLHAVVHDADPLSDETMTAFARRMRLSETSFVQSTDREGADYLHRIFTVAGEIPFAGHPSLGTATAVASATGRQIADLCQLTGAGVQRLHVELDGATAHVDLEQEAPTWLGECDAAPVLGAIGLDPGDGDAARLPTWVVSTGLPTLVLPVRSLAALARAKPDLDRLAVALRELPGQPITLYVVCSIEPGRWRARCFTPAVAGGEDSATGSAAGPLAAYAARFAGDSSLAIDQGSEMGSPSQLAATCDGDRVVVSGVVRVIGSGEVRLPVNSE
jgi:trans-2,3-dihydro-3-hydroxyanthranilate isomerase